MARSKGRTGEKTRMRKGKLEVLERTKLKFGRSVEGMKRKAHIL